MRKEELRKEFTKPTFRKNMKNVLGSICVNCGSAEGIEYHHIVPLANGGTNKLSNIVPLCGKCHDKAHDKKIFFRSEKSGRPPIIEFENAEQTLKRYFNEEIGTEETKRLLGISPKNKSTWYKLLKEYKEKYNIDKFYNHVDILKSQEKRLKNVVGE